MTPEDLKLLQKNLWSILLILIRKIKWKVVILVMKTFLLNKFFLLKELAEIE